ncbi:MAG: hypothetical protein HY304_03560 [candidate division Zixibacteria bacterium]|nr:hypothetical protein [candidate division Zixibacteria bacterium]
MCVIGCGDSNVETIDKGKAAATPHQETTDASTGRPQSIPPPSGNGASAAGIAWNPPAGWKAGAPRPMRAATYTIGTGDGAAECAVFFFGAGQGGEVKANIERWIGQFQQPDGSDSQSNVKLSSRDLSGLKATLIDLAGTYMASMGGPMSGQKESHPGSRLLGAIVEAPEGPVFFKLTGPEAAVAAARSDFDGLLASVKRP